LIFQKTNLKYFISVLFLSFFVMGLLVLDNNSCSVDTVIISGEINSYEKSLDPEICENILEKIDAYNEQCESQIEILDCG